MNEIDFVYKDGKNDCGDLRVYALSTCGFCRRALKFLKKNSIKYHYIYVDKLPLDIKREVKSYLTKKTDGNFGFPFVIINDEKFLRGFKEDEWKEELLNG